MDSVLNLAIGALHGKSVVVIGDLMLDRYILGKSSRLSPEAPVQIIRVDHDDVVSKPGGAANVAMACKALGVGDVKVFGYCSSDGNGATLTQLLQNAHIDTEMVFPITRARGNRTTTKTRIMCDGQQVCRLDEEDVYQDFGYTRPQIDALWAACEEADAIIVSDYNKGVVTSVVLDKAQGHKTFLDPKPEHKHLYTKRAFQAIKPNERELYLMAPESDPSECATSLAMELGCSVVATRGQYGVILVDSRVILFPDAPIEYIPGISVESVDTIGAGDVFMAAMASSWTINGDLLDAARMANLAAAVSVQHPYTYNPTIADMLKMRENL